MDPHIATKGVWRQRRNNAECTPLSPPCIHTHTPPMHTHKISTPGAYTAYPPPACKHTAPPLAVHTHIHTRLRPASSPARPSVARSAKVLGQRLARQGQGMWSAIKQERILYPAVFVFLWQATPSCDVALFYFQTNELGFQPEFLGKVCGNG
eukprot:365903-Chlamydomonas_euryale.AAC.1